MPQIKAVAVSALFLTSVVGISFGDVFYLKTVATNPKNTFTDPAIWGVGSMSDGNADRRYPDEDDWISYGTAYQSYFNFEFGGGSFTVKGVTMTGAAETWGRRTFTLENGTLVFANGFTNNLATVNCNAGGQFVLGDLCASRLGNGGNKCRFVVNANGACTIGGSAIVHWLEVVNNANGTLTFKPNGNLTLKSDFTNASYLENSGSFHLPVGLTVAGPVTASNGTFEFRQKAGTMTLGGDLVKSSTLNQVFPVTDSSQKNVPVRFLLSGGTLEATADAAIRGFDVVRMPDDSVATIAVSENKTLDLSNMTYGERTSLTKSGPGTLSLATVAPTSLALNEGSLSLAGTVFGSLSVGAGVTISPAPSLDEGDVVFSVPDADELNAAVACLTSAPDGLEYVIANNVVSLRKSTAENKTFASNGEASLADPSCWNTPTVPEGEDVFIQGAATIGLFDSSAPVFRSITVMDGATLKVVGTVENLPPIALDTNANILFAENSVVTLPEEFSSNANALQMPVFEVAAGAVVNVGASRKFKNVHIKLYGELDWEVGLILGYALENETAYFGFDSDGGVIRSLKSGIDKTVDWIRPADGGRVKVPGGQLTLRRLRALRASESDYHGFNFGWGNPNDEPVEMILDGTVIDQYGAIMRIASCMTIHCKNGGGLRKPGYLSYWGYYNQIIVNGRLILDSESQFLYHYSRNNVTFSPLTAGDEQMIVRDGSWMAIQYPEGDGRGVARFEDGWWDVLRLPLLDPAGRPEITDARMWTTNVFHGLKSVTVPEGMFVGIRSSEKWKEGTPWDPVAMLDPAVPITGGGSLVLSNATPGHAFTAIVACPKNTATGEAKVLPSADLSTLLFADGANWAGTLVARECVGFTNLTAAASPATVTVRNVRFEGNLPIRVWKSSGVSDRLVITGEISTAGGGFAPVAMDGRFVVGDTVVVGTCPAASLPADYEKSLSSKRWTLSAEPIPGTENVSLKATYCGGSGIFFILR